MYSKKVVKDTLDIKDIEIGFNTQDQFCTYRGNVVRMFDIQGTVVNYEHVPYNKPIICLDQLGNILCSKSQDKNVYDCKGKLIQPLSTNIINFSIVNNITTENNGRTTIYSMIDDSLFFCIRKRTNSDGDTFNTSIFYDSKQVAFVGDEYGVLPNADFAYDSTRKEILYIKYVDHDQYQYHDKYVVTVFDRSFNILREFTIIKTRILCVNNGKLVAEVNIENTLYLYVFDTMTGEDIFVDTIVNFECLIGFINTRGDIIITERPEIGTSNRDIIIYKNIHATTVFLLILGICDSYLISTNDDDINNNNNPITRFFNIVTKLPMELQMSISYYVSGSGSGSGRSIVTVSDVETYFARTMNET